MQYIGSHTGLEEVQPVKTTLETCLIKATHTRSL